MIVHDRLPNNLLRFNHHIYNDPSSPKCGAPVERPLHTLQDCMEALGFFYIS